MTIREHEIWAGPIIFVLAFGESLAIVSLVLPGTAILFALGGLIGAARIDFWICWLAATLGAVLGDWVSYWLGRHFKNRIALIWPLSLYPLLLPRGMAFFHKWGTAGIFLGRFFGPLRSTVPLAAGICEMPAARFNIANIASALVWATGILSPGGIGFRFLL